MLGGITALLLGIFILQFHGSSLSNRISDWGSFGDYIAICTSLISIALIYQTYKEQRMSNKFARFENTYWNLWERLSHGSNHDFEVLKKEIEEHFIAKYDIDINQFICLLNYYWGIHTRQCNMSSHFLEHLKNLYLFVISTNLLNTENKEIYLSLTYDSLKNNELFCFICYLSHYAYCHKNVSILKSKGIINLIIKIGTGLKIFNSNQKQKNLKLLEYHLDEDFGYSATKHKNEYHRETLKRLKIE